MKTFFILLLTFAGQLTANPTFSEDVLVHEDFESDSIHYFWKKSNAEDFSRRAGKITPDKSLAVSYENGEVFYKDLFYHRNSEIVKNGFYSRIYFRIFPDTSETTHLKEPAGANLISFGLINNDDFIYSNPWITLTPRKDGDFKLFCNIRDNTMEGSPLFSSGLGEKSIIKAHVWNCLEIYIRIREDTLMDSVFVNNRFIITEKIALSKEAETFKQIALGSWRKIKNSGIKTVLFDDLVISTNRIGVTPERPKMLLPQPCQAELPLKPLFEIEKDSIADSVRITINIEKETVLDSIFFTHSRLQFGSALSPLTEYSVRMQYKNHFGLWGKWTEKRNFLTSQSSNSKIEPFKKESALFTTRICCEEKCLTLKSGDTAIIEFFPESEHFNLNYSILNISHAEYSHDPDKIWNINSVRENWLVNIMRDLGAPNISAKYIHEGLTTRKEEIQNKDGKNSYDFSKIIDLSSISHENGKIRVPFVITDTLRGGYWTACTKFIEKGGKTVFSYRKYFKIRKGSETRTNFLRLAATALIAAFALWVALRRSLKKNKTRLPKSSVETVKKINKFISLNYTEKLSAADISSAVGLGTHRASEVFKSVTGITPLQKLNEIRIDKAREMLRETGLSISEIGYKTGFSYPRLFQKNFKKETGLTPSEFRKKHKY